MRSIFGTGHESFRASVREYLSRHVAPRLDQFVHDGALPRDVWTEAGSKGFLGLLVPPEYGGEGAEDWRYAAVVLEEMARVSLALASCMGVHLNVVAPYLVQHTTEEQKARWLPRFSSGETVAAIAMTEPSAGSDLAALRTRAVRDGGDWVIDGAKSFVTNALSADLVVLAARTDPANRFEGISLFGVDAATPGFSRGAKLDKVGQPEADTAGLFFQDMRVPGTDLIGDLHQGFFHLVHHLVQERIGAAVSNVAHAAEMLGETIEYVKQRRAFDTPVGSFQYNKFRIAELATQVDVTQAFVDQCVLRHCSGKLSAADAAKVKWWSSQVQNDVLDQCLQLYGGYGYTNDYRIGRAWRDGRVTKIWAGTNEIMKELIGRDLGL